MQTSDNLKNLVAVASSVFYGTINHYRSLALAEEIIAPVVTSRRKWFGY